MDQFDFAFLAFAGCVEDFTQPFHRLFEIGVGAPLGDQLIEGAEKPAAEHVGGDQGADGQALIDDGDGADGGHGDRRHHAQRGADVGIGVRLAAANHRFFNVVGVFVLPQRTHGSIQGQGLDGGASGNHFGDQAVAALAGLAFFAVGGGHDIARPPSDKCEHRQDDQQHPGDGRGDNKNQTQEQDSERQVGDQNGGSAGKSIAHGIDVAEQGLPMRRGLAFQGL